MSEFVKAKENPIILATKIATALFREFGTETDELNGKGEKKWKLPNIEDSISFRMTLVEILKENGGNVEMAIESGKKKYLSGDLKKRIEKRKIN
jgi:hypothetical protein